MTTIGHSLLGLSIAAVAVPSSVPRRQFFLLAALAVLFANLPDLPLPGWGHRAYAVSHSFVVTLVLAGLLFAIVRLWRNDLIVFRGLPWMLTLAWLSHMVLDSTYSHGNGLAVLWPVSSAHLALPVPWFDTLSLPVRSEHNRDVIRTELAVYGALAVLACSFRYFSRGNARG